MADWRTISDTEVDPDAPVTSELAYAFRDNVIAAFEGASGAPSLADAALPTGSGSATASGRAWVAYRTALMTAGQIGNFVFASVQGTAAYDFGTTISGSLLTPQNSSATLPTGSGLSGSWLCLGRVSGTTTVDRTTLFLRVS